MRILRVYQESSIKNKKEEAVFKPTTPKTFIKGMESSIKDTVPNVDASKLKKIQDPKENK